MITCLQFVHCIRAKIGVVDHGLIVGNYLENNGIFAGPLV